MVPTINRFIGALQGITSGSGGGEEAVFDIAESLLANGGFVRDEIAAIVGQSTDSTSASSPLWRAIPFGLLYFDDLDRLQEQVEKSCRLTHGRPSDIAAAIAMALSLARLLRMENFVPLPFVEETAWFVRKVDRDAYTRIRGLIYPLRGELPFLCSDFQQPLELFRAALFLSCQSCDLESEAERLGLSGSAVLPLAYSLIGSFGNVCRLEKPSLRAIMIAEGFHRFAAGRGNAMPTG